MRTMMAMLDHIEIQLEHFFSDEYTFTLHDHANRQNFCHWSREHPHWIREEHTQYLEKNNVCVGIIGDQFIGPFFIAENLNGDYYLKIIQNNVIPILAISYPDEANF